MKQDEIQVYWLLKYQYAYYAHCTCVAKLPTACFWGTFALVWYPWCLELVVHQCAARRVRACVEWEHVGL